MVVCTSGSVLVALPVYSTCAEWPSVEWRPRSRWRPWPFPCHFATTWSTKSSNPHSLPRLQLMLLHQCWETNKALLFFLKKKQFHWTLKNKAGTWKGARMKPLFLVSTPHCTHLPQDVELICTYFIFVRTSVNKWAGVRAPSLPTRSSFCLSFAGASRPLHLISVLPSSVAPL